MGLQRKIDVLKRLSGRKGAFGFKMRLSGKFGVQKLIVGNKRGGWVESGAFMEN